MSNDELTGLLTAELALNDGDVPDTLPDACGETPTYTLSRDAFLLRLPNGVRFHYRRGHGVRVARPASVQDAELAIFVNGSVCGAVAWLNGFVPLHASAVAHAGSIHAFAAVSGAGKSTLAAALGGQGFALFSDDLLILDLREGAPPRCVALQKQLKLWDDAAGFLDAQAGMRVRPGIPKFYAEPAGGFVSGSLPLAQLYGLDTSEGDTRIEPLAGIAKANLARAALYRPHFGHALLTPQALFRIISQIGTVPMANFVRPRDAHSIDTGASMLAATIRAAA